MMVKATPIPGMLVFEPQIFADDRGAFLETWNRQRYARCGVAVDFVQSALSRNQAGILRGLHYTVRRPQAQFVWVSSGAIFDVAVDLRRSSPTFRQWYGVVLSGDTLHQVYLPPGLAHGFCVLGDGADVHYQMTHGYDPEDEFTLNWADPDLAISWPLNTPRLKARDASAPCLSDLGPHQFPDILSP